MIYSNFWIEANKIQIQHKADKNKKDIYERSWKL